MESKDELKELGIKNCTCYYFDDIIRNLDIDFDNILLDKNHIKINKKYFNSWYFIQNFHGCKTIAY